MKKVVLSLVLVGVLTVGGTVSAFADEIVASGFRHNGTTGVKILMENGLTFEEAKTQNLEKKFERVDAAVDRGTINSEEAAKIKVEMESNSVACLTPGEKQGTNKGYGLNKGLNGKGNGNGKGQGQSIGKGAKMGLKDGSCINQ